MNGKYIKSRKVGHHSRQELEMALHYISLSQDLKKIAHHNTSVENNDDQQYSDSHTCKGYCQIQEELDIDDEEFDQFYFTQNRTINNNQEKKQPETSRYIYLERKNRFDRFEADLIEKNSTNIVSDQNPKLINTQIKKHKCGRETLKARTEFICIVIILSLKAILCGIGIQTLCVTLKARQKVKKLLLQHLHRINELQLLYFIATSICLTGSMSMITCYEVKIRKKDTAANITSVRHRTLTKGLLYFLRKLDHIEIVTYYTSLFISLFLALISIQLKPFSDAIISEPWQAELENDEHLANYARNWQILASIRSFCCIIGWLISCSKLIKQNKEVFSILNK